MTASNQHFFHNSIIIALPKVILADRRTRIVGAGGRTGGRADGREVCVISSNITIKRSVQAQIEL